MSEVRLVNRNSKEEKIEATYKEKTIVARKIFGLFEFVVALWFFFLESSSWSSHHRRFKLVFESVFSPCHKDILKSLAGRQRISESYQRIKKKEKKRDLSSVRKKNITKDIHIFFNLYKKNSALQHKKRQETLKVCIVNILHLKGKKHIPKVKSSSESKERNRRASGWEWYLDYIFTTKLN